MDSKKRTTRTTRTTIGRDPRTMSRAELESLGHRKRPLLSAIRQNCVDCAGASPAEVRRCALIACPFWPYRMGVNPFAAERSEEQKATAAEKMRRLNAKRGEFAGFPRETAVQTAAEAPRGREIPAEGSSEEPAQ